MRALALGTAEMPQRADMRRSGAVEGDAGGGTNKMANAVSANNRLRKTYNPVNVPSVRRFDEARVKDAQQLEQRASENVRSPLLVTLEERRKRAKPLK